MQLSTFTFGRWCLPVFLGLSFLCLAQGSGNKPIYIVILVGDDVPLLRGSTSPTSVITQVEVMKEGVDAPPHIAMGVTFFANSSVQCKLVDGHTCYNVSVSEEQTHLYLTAPLSEEPIIKDTLVKLESRLEWPNSIPDKKSIQLRTLDLTLTDNRRLHVGFTRRNTVYFDENSMATLYVMNYDAPLRLEDPLVMSISIRRSDDQRFVKQIRTNIIFSDSNMSLPIIISGQALDSGQDQQYEATIIVQGEQSKYVRLDPASLQLAYSPYFKLKKLFLEEIQKLEQNVTELKRKIDSLELLAERAANKSNFNLPTAATTTKATESTTATTADTESTTAATADTESTTAAISVAPSSSFPPTLTSDPTTPTSSTSQDTVVSSADGDTGDYEPGNGSPDSTEPVTKDNKVVSDATIPSTQSSVIEDSTDDDTDDEVESNDSDAFMWWILGGFVVLMVATVAGYLLYNHRAKVMVYVGNVWKGGSDKLPTTQHQSRRKNKYTPLPTSIHDTLTHED